MTDRQKRYRAFISYSQKDKTEARRLHAALESYRLPRGIDADAIDAKSRKMGRFFRDDDELGAATDLGAALQGAIADSESLIVICSPNAANSKWVNEEIIHFKRTGRSGNIFAVIVAGQPNAPVATGNGVNVTECFPSALRFALGADGDLSDTPAEPLAIDVRREPFHRALTRLVAGLLSTEFDALWRRAARQRRQRWTLNAAMGAAATIALALGGVMVARVVSMSRSAEFSAAAALPQLGAEAALKLHILGSRSSITERPARSAEATFVSYIEQAPPYWRELTTVRAESEIRELALSENGERLAVAAEDGIVRIVEATSGRELQSLSHAQPVKHMDWSHDGAMLATACDDGVVRLWNVSTGLLFSSFPHSGATSYVEFDPSGRFLISRIRGQVIVWDVQERRLRARIDEDLMRLGFSESGDVFFGDASRDVQVRSSLTGALVALLTQDSPGVYTGAFSPDERFLVTSGGQAQARLWDLSTSAEVARLGEAGDNYIQVAVFDSDTRIRAVTRQGGLIVYQRDAGGLWQEALRDPNGPASIDTAFSKRWARTGRLASFPNRRLLHTADGNRIVSEVDANTVRVWGRTVLREVVAAPSITSLARPAFSRDGRWLAGAASGHTVRVWDIASWREAAVISGHEGEVTAVAFAPDSRTLASVAGDKTIRLWRTTDDRLWSEVALMQLDENSAFSLAFSADGSRLVAAGADGFARVWTASSDFQWRESLTLEASDQVTSISFSPDGRLLLTSHADGNVRIWDAVTGQQRSYFGRTRSVYDALRMLWSWIRLEDLTSALFVARFSADGQRIVAASEDGLARVWDLSGRQIAVVRGPPMTDAMFTPDGRRIVTVDATGVKVWDVRTADLLAEFGRREGLPWRAELDSGGNHLAIVASRQPLRLWDARILTRSERPQPGMSYLASVVCATRLTYGRDAIDDEGYYALQSAGIYNAMQERDGETVCAPEQ